MGIQYRNAFRDTRVIFLEYDKLFETGKYNVDLISCIKMSVARLIYPVELEGKAEQAYAVFLTEHLEQAAEVFLKAEEKEKLRWLAETFITTKEQMEKLTGAAMKQEETEVLSMLMDISHRRFPGKKKRFSL